MSLFYHLGVSPDESDNRYEVVQEFSNQRAVLLRSIFTNPA